MSTYNISMGPLLGVESDTLYTVCILIKATLDLDHPYLLINQHSSTPRTIEGTKSFVDVGIVEKYRFYRFEFHINNDSEKEIEVEYAVKIGEDFIMNKYGQSSWKFSIPSTSGIPRLVFGSCASVDGVRPSSVSPENYLGFQKMLELKPHCLILSGDQIYADCITKSDTGFQEYFLSEGGIPESLPDKIDDFYLQLYIESWTCNVHFANVLATIPNVMTWDDHDIIDGYGSHSGTIRNKYNVLFKSAKKYYELFQCRGKYTEVQYLILRNQLFVIPDTRSFREEKVVMKNEQYGSIMTKLSHLEAESKRFYNIYFILPVPIAHMDYTNWVENTWRKITNWLYKQKFVEFHHDDIVDHWDHDYHKAEQLRLLDIIFDYGQKLKSRYLTIVSGDVHCAASALIEKKIGMKKSLYATQFIASPLANNSSSKSKLIIYAITKNTKSIGDYLCTLKKFGTFGRKNMYKRNFLHVYPTSKQINETENKISATYLVSELYYERNDDWTIQDDIRAYKNLMKFEN